MFLFLEDCQGELVKPGYGSIKIKPPFTAHLHARSTG